VNPDKSPLNSGPTHAAAGGGHDYNQLSLWTAAGLAGMVTGMMLARTPFFEGILRRLGHGARSKHRPSPVQSLSMLASAIVGSSKATIQAVFGAPRSVAIAGIGIVVHPRHVYWQSDTWYYPLRRQGPMAIAISFADDVAARVEFFTAPQL
jgi:hypothetical protein